MADMGYALAQLRAAVEGMAGSTEGIQARLQRAWTERLQLLWEDLYLPEALNERFKQLWVRYTAPSDNRRSTRLRELDDDELTAAVAELVALAFDVEVAAAG